MGKALGNIDFPPIIYYLPRAIPTRSADFLDFIIFYIKYGEFELFWLFYESEIS